jgi:hypothetical protein
MPAKKPYLSRTLWINLFSALSLMVFPPAAKFLAEHPVEVGVFFSLLNMGLRLLTKGALEIGS